MKYLTKEIKKYYLDDFNNNVVKCKDSVWKIIKNELVTW
jgi:hypothetical protein